MNRDKRSAEPPILSGLRPVRCTAVAVVAALVLAGCQREQQAAETPPVRVRAETVALTDYAPTFTLTGVIAARTLNNLAFRVGGRVAERLVEVGQHVEKDTVLARLDRAEQETELRSSEADLAAAEAQLRQTTAAFERQKTLLAQGFTTRREYDQAEQAMRVAQGSVDAAKSALANAQDRLTFTELKATASGIITARAIETGQVVQAAQTAFTLAEDGDRDAVFNVNETLLVSAPRKPQVRIALLADPETAVPGEVREVSPAVDPASGSVRVKVAVPNTPPAFTLGAPVMGSVTAQPRKLVVLPWQALISLSGKPGVWTIDAATKAVGAKPVDVLIFDSGKVVLDKGLEPGETVVTWGSQLVLPGQVVEPVMEPAP